MESYTVCICCLATVVDGLTALRGKGAQSKACRPHMLLVDLKLQARVTLLRSGPMVFCD
jgi:hypothetical protein